MICCYCDSDRARQVNHQADSHVTGRRNRRTRWYHCNACHGEFQTMEVVLAHPIIDRTAHFIVTADGLAIEAEFPTVRGELERVTGKTELPRIGA